MGKRRVPGGEFAGNRGQQRGMILFHGDHVMTAGVGDELTRFLLPVQRIGGDHATGQDQLPEQIERGILLVGVGRHGLLSQDRSRLVLVGGDEHHRPLVDPAGAAKRLAVDGDSGPRFAGGNGHSRRRQPGPQRVFKRLRARTMSRFRSAPY